MCKRCNLVRDTSLHKYWSCIYITRFWREVNTLLNYLNGLREVDITRRCILFGVTDNNFVNLVTALCIHVIKRHENLNLRSLNNCVKHGDWNWGKYCTMDRQGGEIPREIERLERLRCGRERLSFKCKCYAKYVENKTFGKGLIILSVKSCLG